MIRQIDFNDAAVLDVVRVLARRADLDLVISGDSSLAQNKRTSLRLRDVTAEQAIDQVLSTSDLFYVRKGKTLLVSVAAPAHHLVGNGEIKALDLKYLQAKKISELLAKVLPEVKVSPGASETSIVLQGQAALLEEARDLILLLDKPAAQVLIESEVLEISRSDSARLGLSFGREQGTFKFLTSRSSGQTAAADDLQTTLNALIAEGKAEVVARPRIATLNNHSAIINIGSRIPYAVPVSSGSSSTQWTVEYIEAGVKLKITPSLGSEGQITTFIQPEVSSVSEWRSTAAGEFPVITTRNAQATLRVKDGETIVVGGLLSESERENVSKLPVLGHLPIVGALFQSRTVEKTKSEIVFLITPHLI
ncbi:secretin and TonB N-terminal domain-containing protein, partial [Candidatus Margulisiibacteriota bacterium]